jgi:hypothetical protein
MGNRGSKDGKVKAGRSVSHQPCDKHAHALELDGTIHDFAALSRFLTIVGRAVIFGFWSDGFPVSRV